MQNPDDPSSERYQNTSVLSPVLGQDTSNPRFAVRPQNQLTWVADGQNTGEMARPGMSRNNPEAGTDGNAAGGGEETDRTTGPRDH